MAARREAHDSDPVGFDPNSAARERTIRIARRTSRNGAGRPYSTSRYFSTNAATPRELNHRAGSTPSLSQARML